MIRKAILMAGGRGQRLMPLTRHTPKPLLPIDNIPVMSRILRTLEKAGIRDVTITTGYLGEQIEERYKSQFRTLRLTYSRETVPLGTAGGVKRAAELFPSADGGTREDDPVLVASGDALFDFDLADFLNTHRKKGADVTMAAKIMEDVSGYGVILGEGGRVTGFAEKPDPRTTPSHRVNAGIYLITKRALKAIPAGVPYDFGRELFPALIERGETLAYYPFDSYWCDIGTPKAYLSCNLHYSGGKSSIGNRCSLDPTASVERSVLLDGCTVEAHCRVEGAILDRGVHLPAGSEVLPGTVVTKETETSAPVFTRG